MILGANSIERLATEHGMIEPYLDYKVSQYKPCQDDEGVKLVSYGQSGAGYDIRLAKVYRQQLSERHTYLDIKDPESSELVEAKPVFRENAPYGMTILNPYETVLGVSYERFRIPTNIIVICCPKSSGARVHMIPHVTPLEPGWGLDEEGGNYLTIEIVNMSAYRNALYYEGILQLIFMEVDGESQYEGYYNSQPAQKPYRATENDRI